MRGIAALSAAALLAITTTPTFAQPPEPLKLMKELGFSEKERKAVGEGKVVARSLSQAVSEREVTAVAVVAVPIPVDQIMDQYSGGRSIQAGHYLRAMGQPPIPPDGTGWEAASFDASEMAEIQEIFGAEPGLDLNLSSEEIAELGRRLEGVPETERRAAVSDAYRSLLQERFRAYVEAGLGGVPPYDRGKGKQTSVADEIRAVWDVESVVAESFPEFYKAVANYPEDQSPEVVNEFFWIKEQFESKFSSRPAFLLEHHAWQESDGFVIVSVRQFFVGHTYNGQQGIGLALPYEGGSLIFNMMSISSDLIERYVRMIALPIGQKIQREENKKLYEKVRREAMEGR